MIVVSGSLQKPFAQDEVNYIVTRSTVEPRNDEDVKRQMNLIYIRRITIIVHQEIIQRTQLFISVIGGYPSFSDPFKRDVTVIIKEEQEAWRKSGT